MSDKCEEAPRRGKDVKEVLGVTEEEMKRNTAFRKMGLTEEDFQRGNEILEQSRDNISSGKKEERITGYTETQLKRDKALDCLGTTEEEIDEARMKELGSLGFK